MIKFLIVRHGHSVANEKQIFAGATDVALSNVGEKQAEAVSDYLINNHKIDAIYSSQLSRAKNTVKKVSEKLNLPITATPSFNEIYGGKWEGQTFEQIFNLYQEDLIKWRTNILTSRCTGGESFLELSKRTVEGLKQLTIGNDGKTVLIATHAGAIRSLITGLKNLNEEQCANLGWVSNASTTTIIYDNESFFIETIGFDDYLKSLKTELPKNI